ncbi:hypothetical protein WDZ17_00055 [Pseudokineococcus basanitobsidens]|uniref:site-specific DNA-methyltransferase (adenine-specific) n=1 Tax=Pseudokineococcus basanitobsidens TaxID=1926649 RepID=A0ABU8RF24_9ACTN
MSTSDALVVGEAWISEHFFASDARNQSFLAKVLGRRKEWDAAEKEGRPTPRSRFRAARGGLEVQLAELTEPADDATRAERTAKAHADLVDVLGLRGGKHVVEDGPLLRVSTPGMTDAAPLVVVRAAPVETVEELLAKDGETLLAPHALDESGDAYTSAARLVSALFVSAEAPRFVLVLAGRWAVLAEQERWAEGRYLAVDVQLVCERNDTKVGGEVDRALVCLAGDSVGPDPDGAVWWTGVLEESVKHTVGVSKDLREGVRLSIEIIANEVVRRRAAQGLEPLPQSEAQPLAKQSLRYLYRILFLLYAEASPELGVLPVGAPEYAQGYSLDRLRELVQVTLTEDRAQHGRHLYESLGVLFRVVDRGAGAPAPTGDEDEGSDGRLTFQPLRADLFRPEAVALIDEVGLGNGALQQVLGHLLLSKESRGRDRGFISYAELGINQLGAVYEGLMSYTGFFAEEDLYEVAKGGDASKGSWVVPSERAEGLRPEDFVRREDPQSHELQPVVHRKGTFVFRLSGRDRQQSASYYTPEVLTRFTVGQALEELLDQDGETTPAADVLGLSVCEPALGSGAFAIEAVRQLAEQYLTRRQDELGQRIDPDEYPRRLQEVKAYLALHNVYGVDLNATAVELAEISLWLDTMVEGLDAPWFGLHLRRGNSLIGARRAVFRRDSVKDGSWHSVVPDDVPLSSLADDMAAGRVGTDVTGKIHHFLLPADGWGSAVDAKEAKALAPEAVDRLKTWRKGLKRKPTTAQVTALLDLSARVEVLWQIALRRLEVAEQEIRRAIPVWGMDDLPSGGAVQREQIEAALADAEGAYQRLRRVMDAWCGLWFWPLTDTLTTRTAEDGTVTRIAPPSLDQWIDALRMLLGTTGKDTAKRRDAGQLDLVGDASWDELDTHEPLELSFAGAASVDTVTAKHPWLEVCAAVAEEQGFFHWDLDFAPVFARGGFDLQVGNPPWVRPETDVDALLAEIDPWWKLEVMPSEGRRADKRAEALTLEGAIELLISGTTTPVVTGSFVGALQQYPHLAALRPDLYRCFITQSWRHASRRGTQGLIHLESHFTDEKAGAFRAETYHRLRRHWHFINEVDLFSDVHNLIQYGVTVHAHRRDFIRFQQACWLYHPDTVGRSQRHDGTGAEPGLKDEHGNWDLRPHLGRITLVDGKTLSTWRELLGVGEAPVQQTPTVFAVNRAAADVMDVVAQSRRIASLSPQVCRGWNETTDRRKGLFESSWGAPRTWDDVILQGPHLFVSTPLYKMPNKTMRSNKDWSTTDFEALAPDAVPVTAYKPAGSRDRYDFSYTHWGADPVAARDHYRLSWRRMAANTGERTLISAILPPGASHVQTVTSLAFPEARDAGLLLQCAAVASAIVSDAVVRMTPKNDILPGAVARLAIPAQGPLSKSLEIRALRLNAVTDAYADLWRAAGAYNGDSWANEGRCHVPIGDMEAAWGRGAPLRRAVDRRQAQVEIDAIVAVLLGVTADQLCTVYRTQFPVLHGYDRKAYFYDANGRLVPNSVLVAWRAKGDRVTEAERTAVHPGSGVAYTYELPFVTYDREEDMRVAHAHFSRLLAERS